MMAAASDEPAGAAIIARPCLRITATRAGGLAEVSAWPATRADVLDCLRQFTCLAVPGVPGQSAGGAGLRVMTLARGRWMVAAEGGAGLAGGLRAAIDPELAAVVDLSAARAAFRLEGRHARELVAKLAPVDLDLPRHGPGCVFQSGAAHHVDVLVLREAAERFTLYADSGYRHALVAMLRDESLEFARPEDGAAGA